MINLSLEITKTTEFELTEGQCSNLRGILLNHIANYDKNVTDDVLKYDIDIYQKIGEYDENMNIEYLRKYIIE